MRVLAVTIALAVIALAISACGSGRLSDQSTITSLAQIRAATAKYQDEKVALAAGFHPTPFCAVNPAGPGAAGIHYVNFALFNRKSVDPLKPDQLLYEPGPHGQRTLVGVEYHVPQANVQSHPSVPGLGHMDGPAPALYKGDSPHYALHLWTRRPNPDGVASPWNRNVRCDPAFYPILSIKKAGGGR
jgi:hypothetical protein